MSEPEDFELLEAWRKGDTRAGNQLVRRHFGRVFRFFRSKLDRGAEDLTQQTFLAVVEGRDRVRNEHGFAAYVFGVARRQLMMALRKRYADAKVFSPDTVSLQALGAPSELGLSAWAAAKQEQALLIAALRQIPIDYQIAVELHYWEHLSVEQISAVVEAPPGTVKSRLSRARTMLQQHIDRIASRRGLIKRMGGSVDELVSQLGAHVPTSEDGA